MQDFSEPLLLCTLALRENCKQNFLNVFDPAWHCGGQGAVASDGSLSPPEGVGLARALQLPRAAFKSLSVPFQLGVLSEPQLSPLSCAERRAQVAGAEGLL